LKNVRYPWLFPTASSFREEKDAADARPTFVDGVGNPEMHLPFEVSISLIAFCFHLEHSTSKFPLELP
jgi:hypothetical protein